MDDPRTEDQTEPYEPPAATDLETAESPSVTAAGESEGPK